MNMMCASRLMPALFTRMSTGPSVARDGFEKRRDVGFVADVAPPRPGAPAAPAHGGDELRGWRVLLAIRDGHGCAALGEELRDAAADAARPAGHDGDTAVELKIVEGHCSRGAAEIISGLLGGSAGRR